MNYTIFISMALLLFCLCLSLLTAAQEPPRAIPIFDVHLHGTPDPAAQVRALQRAGVYKGALSTSWSAQAEYAKLGGGNWLLGLMLPCPNGKVPYSGQPCYEGGEDCPPVAWVEAQIRAGRIQFLGEVLTHYYGISSSDSAMAPYYALAERYGLPVGMHTGGAGPGHGSPNFRPELGNPDLLKPALQRFPRLKVWLMHGGDRFHSEAIRLMQQYPQVYADISVLSNPAIVPAKRFEGIMKDFLQAGLEDRLMFGSDNGDIEAVTGAVEGLTFLTKAQKEGIYYRNAERFFTKDTAIAGIKEYILQRKTAGADLNHRAIQSLSRQQSRDAISAAFEPVQGKATVYRFMATYPGESARGGVKEFHDILVIKTDERDRVIEAYQYTLEWAEMPLEADLYRTQSKGVQLQPRMAVRQLGLQRVLPVRGNGRALADSGILVF